MIRAEARRRLRHRARRWSLTHRAAGGGAGPGRPARVARAIPIYRQTRVGKDGELFEIYKLRTMVSGAEFTGAGPGHRRGRRADHPAGRAAAPLLARRAAQPVERAARRDVDRGAAPDAQGPGATSTPSASAAAWPSSPASPAGRRSTAGPRCPGPSGSNSTCGTSSTARCALDLRILSRTLGHGGAGQRHLQGSRLADGSLPRRRSRPAHGRRQALRRSCRCSPSTRSTIAADPNPLAPAQYAAHHRRSVPRFDDPGYVPALQALCAEFGVGAVVPLTDLDLEILGHAPRPHGTAAGVRARRRRSPGRRLTSTRPTCCCSGSACPRRRRCSRESPSTSYPVMIKPRWGSGARSIHLAQDAAGGRVLGRVHPRAGDDPAGHAGAGVLDGLPLRPRRPLPQRRSRAR